ncbi:hypothetical protein QU24_19715 [Pantoea rodasii]|uniref:Uncharacterized protein n=1 Tax=Pantoea rodasii TaxID=1076549 RepID=A0A0B1R579_9GAMM|nr:hypothetical protein [Pantoea rodasii]KHJ66382.1 hypothetical protein QU24_19715 [Pantoea rodasii]
MLKKTLGFTARVGGVVLLMCLCRAQAQPLVDAAFAGGLPPEGWIILVYLVLIGGACAMALPLTAVLVIFSLMCRATDIFSHHRALVLRDVAALRCGR